MFQDAATFNEDLTILAQGFMAQRADSMIDWVAPYVATGTANGTFKCFDKEDPFQIYDTEIPSEGESLTVHFNATNLQYSCAPHGLKIPITDWERTQAGAAGYEVMRQGKINTLLSTQIVNREWSGWRKIFEEIPAESGKGVWRGSAGASSDPVDEMDDLIEQINNATGAITEAVRSGDPVLIAAARPKLIIADPASMPVIDVPVSRIDVTSLSLKARSDLVPPLVAVIGTDTDSVGCFVAVNSIRPRGGNLQQPGNLIIQLDAGSLPTPESPEDPDEPEDPDKPTGTRKFDNPPTMIIRGATIPTDGDKCREFWARHAQPLSEIKGLVLGAQIITPSPTTGNEGKNYSIEATGYELTEGLISNKTAGIKWCRITLKQALGYPGTSCPPEYEALFPEVRADGHRWGWHTLDEMVTTNTRLRQYRIGGRYEESDPPTPEEEEEEEVETPPPGDITPQQSARYDSKVESYYKATRIVPYDGTIPLRVSRPDIHVGIRINILDSYPAWATMQAIVQTVQTNMASDGMTLTVGPPKHLRLDKSHKLTQQLADQAAETKEETAPDTSGGPTFSWDNQFDRKKKTESPGIGPYCKYIPPSAKPPLNADFAVRAVRAAGGKASYQVHGGRFIGIATGRSFACGSGWEDCSNSEVWANLDTDKGGVPQRAYFSASPGPMNAWMPIWKNDNMSEGIDMSRTVEGHYSYRVASIVNGEIIQHIVGPIPITYYLQTLAF